MDLETPPLMRLTLIRTGAAVWQFIWTTHHLLLDRWSATQVYNEFNIAYKALRSGQRSPTVAAAPLPRLYPLDTSAESGSGGDLLAKQMTGVTSPTVLPIDRGPGSLGR